MEPLVADTLFENEIWAYVLTEKLLPACGAHRASEAPIDLAMTTLASVQMSAATCLTGMPDDTAILRITLLMEACAVLPHAPVVSTTQGEKSHPAERHPSR
jgi:hypothetical protein